jgi:small subunit ribosomal protein S6
MTLSMSFAPCSVYRSRLDQKEVAGMRKYEIMYIIAPNLEESAYKEIVERFNNVLTTNGAEIEKVNEMGKRRLAYEINDFTEGFYVLLNVNAAADSDALNEFNRLIKINDNVIRVLVTKDEQ